MAHDLATTNGKPAVMYAGEVPWHQLGTRLDEPATAREAIEAAGLNYLAELKDVQTVDGTPVPQRKAVVRSDTGDVLGVVGKSYVPVQNYQAFGFLDAIVAEGGLRYHTAGALGNGERVWMLAKLPDHIRVKGSDDLVEKFLLLSNSHDGSTALRTLFTPIRVVCQNTLNLALREGRNQGMSILHKGDLTGKIREAQRVLGLAERFYDDAAAKIDILASHYPTVDQVQRYFESLYPDPTDADNSRAKRVRGNLTQIFETGIGLDMPAIKGTSWAAFNAVTEWVDHHRPTRAADPTERASRRLESAWWGSGATLKAKAWNQALSLALSI
jgi:phage/plasmid-like protein (TIGR03299 family)